MVDLFHKRISTQTDLKSRCHYILTRKLLLCSSWLRIASEHDCTITSHQTIETTFQLASPNVITSHWLEFPSTKFHFRRQNVKLEKTAASKHWSKTYWWVERLCLFDNLFSAEYVWKCIILTGISHWLLQSHWHLFPSTKIHFRRQNMKLEKTGASNTASKLGQWAQRQMDLTVYKITRD